MATFKPSTGVSAAPGAPAIRVDSDVPPVDAGDAASSTHTSRSGSSHGAAEAAAAGAQSKDGVGTDPNKRVYLESWMGEKPESSTGSPASFDMGQVAQFSAREFRLPSQGSPVHVDVFDARVDSESSDRLRACVSSCLPPASPVASGPSSPHTHELLGKGAFGSVFRVSSRLGSPPPGFGSQSPMPMHAELPPMAVKVVPQQGAEALAREARCLAEMTANPYVQSFSLPVGADIAMGHGPSGDAALAMQFVEGRTLRAEMDALGGLPEAQKLDKMLRYTKQVVSALAVLQEEAGITHCDLKPENIMIHKKHDCAMLVDFGMAKHTATPIPGNRVGGTAPYMAPECFGFVMDPDNETAGYPQVDLRRTDVYSLGVIAFEMWHGHLPVGAHGGDLEGLMGRHMARGRAAAAADGVDTVLFAVRAPADPAAPTRFERLSQDFIRLQRDMLSVDPAQRPTPRQILENYPCMREARALVHPEAVVALMEARVAGMK